MSEEQASTSARRARARLARADRRGVRGRAASGPRAGDLPGRQRGLHEPRRLRPDDRRVRRDVRAPDDHRDPGVGAGRTLRRAVGRQARLPRGPRRQPGVDGAAGRQPVRDARSRPRVRASAGGDRDAGRRVRADGSGREPAGGGVVSRPCERRDPRAQRLARPRHGPRAPADRGVRRARRLVGSADHGRRAAGDPPHLQRAAAAAGGRCRRRRKRPIRRSSGCSAASRSVTAWSRR